ncbi:MAG TPA: hypothetical protein VLC91_14840, partial [Spongiibacteraceae bacterium]|nr:hypothetical protein [Spongiibacteraceae bacterium]
LADDSGFISYLLLWAFTSMVFFTAAHNIIWPYALSALPAFAILTVELWSRWRVALPINNTTVDTSGTVGPRLLAASFATPLVMLILTAVYSYDQQVLLKSSQRDTAQFYLQARPSAASGLYYFRRRYYSGEFYSAGKAQVATINDVERLHNNGVVDFFVIQSDDFAEWPAEQRAYFKTAAQFGEFVVLEEVAPPTTPAPQPSE